MTSPLYSPNTNQSLISLRNNFNTLLSTEPPTSNLHVLLSGTKSAVLTFDLVSMPPQETFDVIGNIGDCLLFVQICNLLSTKAIPKNKIKACLNHLFNIEKNRNSTSTNIQTKVSAMFSIDLKLKKRFTSLLFDLYASNGILSYETSMQILDMCSNFEREQEKENHIQQIEQDLINTMLSDPQVQQDIETQKDIVLKYLPTNIVVQPIDMWFLIQFVNNLETLVSANRLVQRDKNNPNQVIPLSQENIRKIILNMLDQDDLMACKLKMPYRILFKDVVDERIGNGLVTEPIFLLALDKILKKVKRHKDRKERARNSEKKRQLEIKNRGQSILTNIQPKKGDAIVVEMADRRSQNIQANKKLGFFSLGTTIDIGEMSLPEDVLDPEILESIEPIDIASIPNVENVADILESNVSIPTLEQNVSTPPTSTPSDVNQDTSISSPTTSDSNQGVAITSQTPSNVAQAPSTTPPATPPSNNSDDKSKNEKSNVLLWSLLGAGVIGIGAYMYMQGRKKPE